MRGTLEKLWTLLFVALVQLPVAAVVGVLVGKTDLAIWVMGIAAHQAVRSATLSLGRRSAIWLGAMTAGGATVALGAIAASLLMRTTADYALGPSGQVTNVFWIVVAVRLAITWIPVAVAWLVSGVLIRRSVGRGRALSQPVMPRPTTNKPAGWSNLRPAQSAERQGAPRPTTKIVREVLWFVGCVVGNGALVMFVLAIDPKGLAAIEWTPVIATVFATFGLVTLVRVAVWLVRGGAARRFQYWPEVVLVAGVCALAYGGSGIVGDYGEDFDRYLATIGAGLTITAALVRRRLAPQASPAPATRQGTHDRGVQDESEIQPDRASIERRRVRETRPSTYEQPTQGGDAVAMKRAWGVLLALAVVAVLLVGFLNRDRQEEPQASTGLSQKNKYFALDEEEERQKNPIFLLDEEPAQPPDSATSPTLGRPAMSAHNPFWRLVAADEQARETAPYHEKAQAALAEGAMAGDIAAMERALDSGADVNAEWFIMSPLAWAISRNQLPAAKFLVTRGADINAHFGLPKRTALQEAAEGGNLDIVAYLVEAGADINARNKFGRTALYHARHGLFHVQAKAKEVAGYLVSKGAVE